MLREICKVFTKRYREETRYQEFLQSFVPRAKLKDDGENLTAILDRLRNAGYKSNFYLRIV